MKEIAIAAAKEAGKILMDNFGKVESVDIKDFRELVSNVDVTTENKIIEVIKSEYPEHGILCEESEEQVTDSEYKWIIDPLDGTHNYIYGMPAFGTSIALEHNDEVVLGVLNIPYEDELYLAEKGRGAYLNGESVIVSRRPMQEALVLFDSRLDESHGAKAGKIEFLSVLVEEVFGLRMTGSSVRNLSLVASGRA
ncbi:inositol monophosphatase, partial [Candidatus Poribacteria bacterium]|nr:inositol monophosphatase [Candidatus Poribacteria bacterium]